MRVLAIVDALRNFARIGRNSSEIKEGIIGQGFCQDNGANPQNSRRTNPYYDICIRMFLVRLSPVRCTSTRTFTRKNNPNQTTNSILNALLIMNNKKKKITYKTKET